jgi:hypothetical protein
MRYVDAGERESAALPFRRNDELVVRVLADDELAAEICPRPTPAPPMMST